MKKQTIVALVLLLLIPVVSLLGGLLFSKINPEIAAGHPNYERNFHILSAVKVGSILASEAIVVALWLAACFLVIRSKGQSMWWMICAALGPLGFAILVALKDPAFAETDRYGQFVRNLNKFVRIAYEVCLFLGFWQLAYQAMVLKRNLMIMYESATTGVSASQIIATQNASSGMWAFGESLEVLYLVVVFYVLWPVVFNVVALLTAAKPVVKSR